MAMAVPMPYGLLIKPVSGQCNLSCQYCFYRHQKPGPGLGSIRPDVLERLVADYLSDAPHGTFAWQGGEPALAGIGFYQHVLELQSRHRRPGQGVLNAFQTNATLLTQEWTQFLADNHFLVGVSIDGRQGDHDKHRRDFAGAGSFSRVMEGVTLLRQRGVEFNVLTVVTEGNAANPWRLYSALKKHGTQYLQLIPLMECPENPGSAPLTLTPASYGRLLCELFDYWYADLQTPRPMSVRTFDNAVGLVTGIPSETCVFQRGCPASPIIEADGSVYPCDFFVTPEWKLGNLMETPLGELVRGPAMARFRQEGAQVPQECRACRWFGLCNGGCMAERLFAKNAEATSYYCESYKAFFSHSHERLRQVARMALQRGPASR